MYWTGRCRRSPGVRPLGRRIRGGRGRAVGGTSAGDGRLAEHPRGTRPGGWRSTRGGRGRALGGAPAGDADGRLAAHPRGDGDGRWAEHPRGTRTGGGGCRCEARMHGGAGWAGAGGRGPGGRRQAPPAQAQVRTDDGLPVGEAAPPTSRPARGSRPPWGRAPVVVVFLVRRVAAAPDMDRAEDSASTAAPCRCSGISRASASSRGKSPAGRRPALGRPAGRRAEGRDERTR